MSDARRRTSRHSTAVRESHLSAVLRRALAPGEEQRASPAREEDSCERTAPLRRVCVSVYGRRASLCAGGRDLGVLGRGGEGRSVNGPQQHFLCHSESLGRCDASPLLDGHAPTAAVVASSRCDLAPAAGPAAKVADAEAAAELARQITAGMVRRGAEWAASGIEPAGSLRRHSSLVGAAAAAAAATSEAAAAAAAAVAARGEDDPPKSPPRPASSTSSALSVLLPPPLLPRSRRSASVLKREATIPISPPFQPAHHHLFSTSPPPPDFSNSTTCFQPFLPPPAFNPPTTCFQPSYHHLKSASPPPPVFNPLPPPVVNPLTTPCCQHFCRHLLSTFLLPPVVNPLALILHEGPCVHPAAGGPPPRRVPPWRR